MLRELREFGEPRSSGWGMRVRWLLSGDEMSEREEREVLVAAEAELPGRLEGMVGRGERRGRRRRMGTWDARAETRKGSTRNIRELISPEDRVLYCHQPSSKLCV